MTNITEYQQRFAQIKSCSFYEKQAGITVVAVRNQAAQADISLYAAHVLSYMPNHADDLLWLSSTSYYQAGEAIRGGIPLCWPWFGPAADPKLPAHGFARLVHWELVSITESSDQQTDLVFRLSDNEHTRSYWPHRFTLDYHVSIAAVLRCDLITHNTGSEAFTISQALHSYFSVDSSVAEISGLEHTAFTSDTEQDRASEATAIRYTGEIDRVYHDSAARCLINDPSAQRSIAIAKENSQTTVVWNPGPAIAKAKADFDDDGYKRMFCVETCNVAEDAREIAPGAEHRLSAIISLS